MAKQIYRESSVTELVGTLDINLDGSMVVYVENKDEPPREYDIIDLLEKHKGEQISLKLVDEQVD